MKKRFIRNICGQIYDTEEDKFYHEDYRGKPLEYEDEVIRLLNKLSEENEQLKRLNGKQQIEIEILSEELAQAKAVIDKRWKEYLESKGDVE